MSSETPDDRGEAASSRRRIRLGEARRDKFARMWRYIRDSEQPVLWLIALIIGAASGAAATGFRMGVSVLGQAIYGADQKMIHSAASALDWRILLFAPVLGGLAVGLILHLFTPDGKARTVADVIEARALRNARVDRRIGFASALASMVSLGAGASSGREGPVVHLAATLASWVNDRLGAPVVASRTILGCAVAAAVSASFNTPIAGALFALEVVLGHYAARAFGPIVMASVTGAVISRNFAGEMPTFLLPKHMLEFYSELPAFAILGVVCAVVAVVMMKSIFLAEDVGDRVQRALHMPDWLRPAAAGLILGGLAVFFPHVIGVGYETTSLALSMEIAMWTVIAFAAVKVLAVAVTFGGRFGGGVFSPSLMVGALTGSAYGFIATGVFPSTIGSEGLYALAGMGAVAAAVLGAPISTTLIAFELTGDYQAAITVMVSVSVATVLSQQAVDKSFFLTQLERSGLHIAAGPQRYLLATLSARHLMRSRGAEDGAPETAAWSLVEQGVFLQREDTLEKALPMFDALRGPFIPVVETTDGGGKTMIGALFRNDALRAYNRALVEVHEEEHA